MTALTIKEQQEQRVQQFADSLGEMTDAKKLLDKACLKQIIWEHRDKKTEDVLAFLRKAQLVGADPRLNEIYLVAYGNKSNIIYNYQFIMNKAAESARFPAIQSTCSKETVYDPIKEEELTDLVATAWTIIDGEKYIAKAEFKEFYNARNPTWKNYTKSMLEKCAVVKLCRRIPNTGINDMRIAEEATVYDSDSGNENQEQADRLTDKFSSEVSS